MDCRAVKAADVMRDVGLRVRELRCARSWSQEKFAERLHVDARTLQRVEAGTHITFPVLCALATALRVPIADLFAAPVLRERRQGRPPKELVQRERRSPASAEAKRRR